MITEIWCASLVFTQVMLLSKCTRNNRDTESSPNKGNVCLGSWWKKITMYTIWSDRKLLFSMIRKCSPRWRPSMINRQYQTSRKCWLAGSLALTPKNPNTKSRRNSLPTGLCREEQRETRVQHASWVNEKVDPVCIKYVCEAHMSVWFYYYNKLKTDRNFWFYISKIWDDFFYIINFIVVHVLIYFICTGDKWWIFLQSLL